MSEGEYREMKRDLEELLEIARKMLGKYGAKLECVDFEYVDSITGSRVLGARVSSSNGIVYTTGNILKHRRYKRLCDSSRNPGLAPPFGWKAEHAEHDEGGGSELS